MMFLLWRKGGINKVLKVRFKKIAEYRGQRKGWWEGVKEAGKGEDLEVAKRKEGDNCVGK